MTEEHVSDKFSEKGLSTGIRAPNIKISDIYGNEASLDDLLKTYDFILIDFFRGAW